MTKLEVMEILGSIALGMVNDEAKQALDIAQEYIQCGEEDIFDKPVRLIITDAQGLIFVDTEPRATDCMQYFLANDELGRLVWEIIKASYRAKEGLNAVFAEPMDDTMIERIKAEVRHLGYGIELK